jgi:hypothetical protein
MFSSKGDQAPLRRLSSSGSVAPKRVAHILNTYVLAFFQQNLLDEPSTLFSQGAKGFSRGDRPGMASLREIGSKLSCASVHSRNHYRIFSNA